MSLAVARETEQHPYAFGGTAIVLFGLQVVTGLLLAARYVPTAAGAHASILAIANEAPYGWFLRGVHRAAAGLMVAVVLVHLARTFLAGAYRAPRRATWVVGVGLLVLTLAFGFTGTALVGEAASAAATAVGLRLLGSVASLLGGRGEVTGRMYMLHVAALPVAVLAMGLWHVVLVRRHPPPPEDPGRVPFSRHLLTQAFVGAVAVTLAVALALAFPPLLGPAAGAAAPHVPSRPEWFFLPEFALLKVMPRDLAITLMGLGLIVTAAWPWLEERAVRGRRSGLAAAAARAILVLGPLALALWEALS